MRKVSSTHTTNTLTFTIYTQMELFTKILLLEGNQNQVSLITAGAGVAIRIFYFVPVKAFTKILCLPNDIHEYLLLSFVVSFYLEFEKMRSRRERKGKSSPNIFMILIRIVVNIADYKLLFNVFFLLLILLVCTWNWWQWNSKYWISNRRIPNVLTAQPWHDYDKAWMFKISLWVLVNRHRSLCQLFKWKSCMSFLSRAITVRIVDLSFFLFIFHLSLSLFRSFFIWIDYFIRSLASQCLDSIIIIQGFVYCIRPLSNRILLSNCRRWINY